MSARRYIKLPTVPRTRDDIPDNGALGEWSTCVRADSVQCVKPAFQMKQRHDPSRGNEFTPRTDGNVRRRRDPMKLRHLMILKSVLTFVDDFEQAWRKLNRPGAAVHPCGGFSVHFSSVGGPRSTVPVHVEWLAPEPRCTTG